MFKLSVNLYCEDEPRCSFLPHECAQAGACRRLEATHLQVFSCTCSLKRAAKVQILLPGGLAKLIFVPYDFRDWVRVSQAHFSGADSLDCALQVLKSLMDSYLSPTSPYTVENQECWAYFSVTLSVDQQRMPDLEDDQVIR